MEIKKEVTKKVEETVDIICDVCGKSCGITFDGETSGFEFLKLSAHWGFFSSKDMQQWEAHICESCVDEKFSFIKFKKSTYRL